jgi:hypothetical protein
VARQRRRSTKDRAEPRSQGGCTGHTHVPHTRTRAAHTNRTKVVSTNYRTQVRARAVAARRGGAARTS